MRPPVPSHVETLSPYIPGKPIEETQREFGLTDVIKLASNENPLGPSPKAMEAIARALSGMHLYPDASCFSLRRRLAEKLGVAPEEIVLGSGSNEIIELLIRTFMDEGDEGLLCQGSFVMYKTTLHAHNRPYVEVPMREHRYDLEAMAERVGPRTRLVFLANPDNPTGTWFGRKPLERFLDRASRANPDALLVLDEAYFEYTTDPDYPDSLVYRRDYPNLVTLRTFSKIYGLAALRLGYGVMSPRLAEYMNRTRMPFNVAGLAQAGGLAAIEDDEHVRRTREVNAREVAVMSAALSRLGAAVLPSQTNFVFADFKRTAAPLYEALLRKGVIVRPVAHYGFPTALRISVGAPSENQRLIAALKEVLAA